MPSPFKIINEVTGASRTWAVSPLEGKEPLKRQAMGCTPSTRGAFKSNNAAGDVSTQAAPNPNAAATALPGGEVPLHSHATSPQGAYKIKGAAGATNTGCGPLEGL